MKIINNTEQTINFQYGEDFITLPSGDIFEFDCFQIEKLCDIKLLFNSGFVTLYDNEDEEEPIPFDLLTNTKISKNAIVPKSAFGTLNFEKDID